MTPEQKGISTRLMLLSALLFVIVSVTLSSLLVIRNRMQQQVLNDLAEDLACTQCRVSNVRDLYNRPVINHQPKKLLAHCGSSPRNSSNPGPLAMVHRESLTFDEDDHMFRRLHDVESGRLWAKP